MQSDNIATIELLLAAGKHGIVVDFEPTSWRRASLDLEVTSAIIDVTNEGVIGKINVQVFWLGASTVCDESSVLVEETQVEKFHHFLGINFAIVLTSTIVHVLVTSYGM